MDLYWKIVAGALVAAVLGLSLGRDSSVLLSMAVCAMGAAAALYFLEPVLELLREVDAAAASQGDTLSILFRAAGLALVGELAAMICTDAGNASLGRLLKMASCAGVLWVAIPLFRMVLDLLRSILGEA